WLTHLATNGAGTIHDWEYAWLGSSTESVENNVATGTFGTWHETASNIHLALMAGALDGLGYGCALGRFILEDGAPLPSPPEPAAHLPPRAELPGAVGTNPTNPLTAARAELLRPMREQEGPEGRIPVEPRGKHASIIAQGARHDIPLTVHPGIGYDIIANHPV